MESAFAASSYSDRVVPLESIAVLGQLERIAQNGVYFSNEGDRRGRVQIAGYDHLMTTVYIDGAPYLVDMRVRVEDERAGAEIDCTTSHPKLSKSRKRTMAQHPRLDVTRPAFIARMLHHLLPPL